MSLTEKENTIFMRLREIVAYQLSIAQDKITLTSNFISDLKADSLDMVELVMAIEEEFDLEIPDDDVGKIDTVRDAIRFINNKTEE
uniref:acyl carrier protein n=1 Tax=Catenella fusiformis TaxID=3024791 RepID=UPI0027DA23D2|nr:acyl carrier protein [Catenella fusiformis]WCH57549.1 acyl carrier protein [Catenella fusiformis]